MGVIRFNFLSQYLGFQTNVTICLPTFSFADVMKGTTQPYVPGMKYQSLLLLHGGSGDDSDYLHFSSIVRYADDHKVAVIMPSDYNADYTDSPTGPKYLRYVAEELPLVCRTLFPLSEKREDNFIGGLSMGSHGAMKIALLYPERFAAALVMSGAARHPDTVATGMRPMRPAGMDPDIMPMPDIQAIYGDAQRYAKSRDNAYKAAAENVAAGKPLPRFFFACGDKDFALDRCRQGHDELQKLGYYVSFELTPGYGHEWDFWDLTLRKAIGEWLPLRRATILP